MKIENPSLNINHGIHYTTRHTILRRPAPDGHHCGASRRTPTLQQLVEAMHTVEVSMISKLPRVNDDITDSIYRHNTEEKK